MKIRPDLILATDRDKLEELGLKVITYSSVSKFRNCRQAFDFRVNRSLVRKGARALPLRIGSAFHDGLEAFYLAVMDGKTINEAELVGLAVVEKAFSVLDADDELRIKRLPTVAMFRFYVARWARGENVPAGQTTDQEFEIVATEKEFVRYIVNPATKAKSKSFVIAGKVDGVVRWKQDGKLYIRENKTASGIDGTYLAKLWTDFQSRLYARFMADVFEEPVVGVFYDISSKPTIRQSLPETAEAFEERITREKANREKALREKGAKPGESKDDFEARLAGYKTEKTREKHLATGPKKGESSEEFEARVSAAVEKKEADLREKGMKPGESDEEFSARLSDWLSQEDAYHRELITFDERDLDEVEAELWEQTQQLLDARRREVWSQNTTSCFAWGRACDYFELCRSGRRLDEVSLLDFEKKAPHSELTFLAPEEAPVAAQGDEGKLFDDQDDNPFGSFSGGSKGGEEEPVDFGVDF